MRESFPTAILNNVNNQFFIIVFFLSFKLNNKINKFN